jgi:hypothetical protein
MIALVECQINELLHHTPWLRVAAKRAYQFTLRTLSPKERARPSLVRVTPDAGKHLFGYHDKSPWDASGRYMLTIRVTCPAAAHRKSNGRGLGLAS